LVEAIDALENFEITYVKPGFLEPRLIEREEFPNKNLKRLWLNGERELVDNLMNKYSRALRFELRLMNLKNKWQNANGSLSSEDDFIKLQRQLLAILTLSITLNFWENALLPTAFQHLRSSKTKKATIESDIIIKAITDHVKEIINRGNWRIGNHPEKNIQKLDVFLEMFPILQT